MKEAETFMFSASFITRIKIEQKKLKNEQNIFLFWKNIEILCYTIKWYMFTS